MFGKEVKKGELKELNKWNGTEKTNLDSVLGHVLATLALQPQDNLLGCFRLLTDKPPVLKTDKTSELTLNDNHIDEMKLQISFGYQSTCQFGFYLQSQYT